MRGNTAAEAGCRGRLDDSADFDERAAGLIVRVFGRFVHVEHRRHAGVAAFQQRTPFVACAGFEVGGEAGLQLGPAGALPLLLEVRVGDAGLLQEQGVELGFDGADGNVLAVGTAVGVVEVGAAIEQVAAAFLRPVAHGLEGVHHGHQQGRAVGHGGIDHLAFAGGACFEGCGEDADHQQHGATATVGNQVERHHRLAAGLADGVQRAGQGQVVDVMPSRVGQRAGLAPAGHAAVDETRVGGEAIVRAEAEAFHHAGAEAFDQHVGAGCQLFGGGEAFGLLQVEADDPPAAVEDVDLRVEEFRCRFGARRQLALDAHDLGAQVGEDHAAHRGRAEGGEFNDPDAVEWSHAVSSFLLSALVGRTEVRQAGAEAVLSD